MHTVLFICTGNTCRSPMAEAIAQHWLASEADRLPGSAEPHLVVSAGVAAGDGAPTAAEAVAALERHGIEFSGRSTQLTARMIQEANVVLGMTAGHVAAARSLVAESPDDQEKIHALDPDGDIEDPVGLGQDVYDTVADRLRDLVPRRIKELLTHEDRAGV